MNTKSMRKNLKRKNKSLKIRKAVVRLTLSVMLFGTFMLMFVNWLNGSIPTKYEGEYTEYIVSDGDRLWDIAEEFSSNKDVREVVYTIKRDNNLESSNLSIGQVLQIRNEF
ncbi:LysM peptidoglycan-binding domain-containing protein [uncultured Clostridium sp.]|uniref:LysM peptidoglycan-binding domain-containing protein n=1 Tax=uncultured Clostridium sp. TaxID=59620 RepID=UPI0026EA3165|nr:LysM peptidoglycan-binding domain-containing protein [uncultured Clostridium sp.]